MTSDLTEFLIARIAEDEAAATQSIVAAEVDEPWGYGHLADDGPHIARWSPARVMGECQAKRHVIVWHQQYNSTGCGGDENHGREDRCPTLCALALPYANHPDYDEAWRP